MQSVDPIAAGVPQKDAVGRSRRQAEASSSWISLRRLSSGKVDLVPFGA